MTKPICATILFWSFLLLPCTTQVWVGNYQPFMDPCPSKVSLPWLLFIWIHMPHLRVMKTIDENLWAGPPTWETEQLGLGVRSQRKIFSHYYCCSHSLSSNHIAQPYHLYVPSVHCPSQQCSTVTLTFCFVLGLPLCKAEELSPPWCWSCAISLFFRPQVLAQNIYSWWDVKV